MGRPMHITEVHSEPSAVHDRLARFGLEVSDFYPVLHAVAAARADWVPVDAATSRGAKAWLAGVRHTNLMMLPQGWKPGRVDGVEEVRRKDGEIAFVYQNVDQACSPVRSPRAISAKGPAADRIVGAQGDLFGHGLPEAVSPRAAKNEVVWFVCVSVNDETGEVCAELSLPTSLVGNNFATFAERIFLIQPGEWALVDYMPAGSDLDTLEAPADYPVAMSKK